MSCARILLDTQAKTDHNPNPKKRLLITIIRTQKSDFLSPHSVKLADLSEGASLVGAERLKRVFDKHMTLRDGKAELDEEGSGYPLLLKELKLLSRSLPPVPPPSSPESPPKERKKEKSG